MPQFKCSNCGGTFNGVPKFCPHCGSMLTNANAQPSESVDPFLNADNNEVHVFKPENVIENKPEVEQKPEVKIEPKVEEAPKAKKEKPMKKEVEEQEKDLKGQNVFVIVGFSLAMLAVVLLGMIYVDIYFLKDLDAMIRVIALPSLSILAWITAGVANIFVNKGDDVKGAIKALKIIGKIFAIIALWVAVLATISSAFVATAYFASQWISTFIDLDFKAIIEEFLATGQVTIA